MNVEKVRVILERTFGMPVSESDAQIVLDRLVEFQAVKEAAEHCVHTDAVESAASSEVINASADTTSQTVTKRTQRG